MQMESLQQDQKIKAKGTGDDIIPMRATYFNLYKWPESDCKFIESIVLRGGDGRSSSTYGDGTAVDGFSCRQLYLRSYTFSRKDDCETVNCFGRCKNKMKRRFCVGSRSKCALRRWLCFNNIDVID